MDGEGDCELSPGRKPECPHHHYQYAGEGEIGTSLMGYFFYFVGFNLSIVNGGHKSVQIIPAALLVRKLGPMFGQLEC